MNRDEFEQLIFDISLIEARAKDRKAVAEADQAEVLLQHVRETAARGRKDPSGVLS